MTKLALTSRQQQDELLSQFLEIATEAVRFSTSAAGPFIGNILAKPIQLVAPIPVPMGWLGKQKLPFHLKQIRAHSFAGSGNGG